VLWKAEIRNRESRPDNVTLDRIMEILVTDLRNRCIDFDVPSDPLTDNAWILLLQRTYADLAVTAGGQRATLKS
jgi:hypothetical protein